MAQQRTIRVSPWRCLPLEPTPSCGCQKPDQGNWAHAVYMPHIDEDIKRIIVTKFDITHLSKLGLFTGGVAATRLVNANTYLEWICGSIVILPTRRVVCELHARDFV